MTLGHTLTAFEDENANSYTVLGISTTATQEEIARAYKQLASRYHPDRPKTGDSLIFARVAKAYELIQNPVNRALYDLDCGLAQPTPDQLTHIHHLRRQEAMQTLRLLFAKVHHITQLEQSVDGLLILHARYGDLSSPSHLLDVTMQLQAKVCDSTLIVRGGTSKSWLEGFYDPTEGGENELEVVYKMSGVMHRVTVSDEDELVMPREEDRMTVKQVKLWEKEYKLRGVDLVEMKKKRNRRVAAYAVLTGVVVGGVVWGYRRRKGEGEEGGWVEGIGGVVGRGGVKVSGVVSEWLKVLTEMTGKWIAQMPTGGRLASMGQELVSTVSTQWTGRPAVPAMNR